MIDYYAPWMKNIVNEGNIFALQDGLKVIDTFVANFDLSHHH